MESVLPSMPDQRAATRIAQRGGGNPIAWANQFPLPLLCPGVKSTTLFENDGGYVRLHHRQTSGNPVRIGDGCATVTGYKLPQPLVTSREGGSEDGGPKSGYRFDCARRGPAGAGPTSPSMRRMRPFSRTGFGQELWNAFILRFGGV